MAAPKGDSPQQLLQVFKEWRHEAATFIYSVAEWRKQQTFGYGYSATDLKNRTPEERQKLVPKPRRFPVLEKHTKTIVEWLEEKHGIPTTSTRSLQVINDAAGSWHREKNADQVPEYRVLDLERRIGCILMSRAAFPLIALSNTKPQRGAQPILVAFLKYAQEIDQSCDQLERDWPDRSEERYRYHEAVNPKYIKDVPKTALPLAIAEADRNGRLLVLLGRLKSLDKAIARVTTTFAEGPRDFSIRRQMFAAMNELILFMADPKFEPANAIETKPAEWASASETILQYRECGLTIHKLRTIIKNPKNQIRWRSPQKQRLEIHIVDMRAYAQKTWSKRQYDPAPEVIQQRARAIRAAPMIDEDD